MNTQIVTIPEVFLNNSVLNIPFFQRAYVWRDENWDRFFEDMTSLMDTDDSYFMGTLIMKKNGRDSEGHAQYDIIDGQQRLTTLMIFSKILYTLALKNQWFNNRYLFRETNQSILRPGRQDESAFNVLISMDLLKDMDERRWGNIARAYNYFRNRLRNGGISIEQLISRMENQVVFARIILEQNENEQQIFESLNSLGQDLTTGELLKNYLFNRGNEDVYTNRWMPLFENTSNYTFWSGSNVNGRRKSADEQNVEKLFYHLLQIIALDGNICPRIPSASFKQFRKRGSQFANYQNLVNTYGVTKESLIDVIVDYGNIYKDTFGHDTLEKNLKNVPAVDRISFIMQALGFWTPVPYILYIQKNVPDANERERIFRYLETYLVRRIICGTPNNSYADLFSENLIGQGVKTFEALKAYLTDADNRDNLLMPSDESISNAICQNTSFMPKEAKVILYLLESRINPRFAASSQNNSYNALNIEQVMPVKPNNAWPLAAGQTEDDRRELSYRLGNYMIVRTPVAAKVSKDDWSRKKAVIKSDMDGERGLELSRLYNFQEWTKQQIDARNANLARMIAENYPCQ